MQKKDCTKSFKFNYIRIFHHLMKATRFVFQFFLLQYLKEVRVSSSCIWLCDLLFCYTYILLWDFFTYKVLRLGIFYFLNKDLFSFIIFGLGPQLETNQGSQPQTPPCPLNMVWKDKKSGWRHGQNGNVKLAFALSHIFPNGC
jgi:hypothetical protein